MALAQRIGQEFKNLRDNELTLKVDKEVGKGLSTEDYTTAEKSKLASIEPNATADQTGAEIKVLYEGELDTNAFTDAEKAKLLGIEAGAQVNVADTLTTLTLVGNILTYTDEDGGIHNFDLSLYLDDTNLARIVSGSYDELTNSIIFSRDDATTFSVDITAFLGDSDFQSAVSGNVDVAANTAARHTHANKTILDNIDQELSTVASPNFVNPTSDTVQLNGGIGTQGTLNWNIDEETLSLAQNDNILDIGQETVVHCRNTTISTILAGTVVMASGTVGASGRITIEPMGITSNLVSRIVGITTNDISSGSDGKVAAFGKIRNIDTSAWLEGDVLYVDTTTPGLLTNVKPTSEIVLPIAFVVTSHASAGAIMARITPINELFNEGAATWGLIEGTLSDQADLQAELDAKQDNLTFDAVPTSASTNPVESGGVFTELSTKQDSLTFDSVPVNLSTNPVTSNGIYNADLSVLASAQGYTDTELANYDLSTVVDSKDTATLASANGYTDTELLNYTTTIALNTLLDGKATLDSAVSFDTITPTNATSNLGTITNYFDTLYAGNIRAKFDGSTGDTVNVLGTRFTSLNITTDESNLIDSDPVLALINSNTGNNWSIRNDTSDSASFDVRYNNVRQMNLSPTGELKIGSLAQKSGNVLPLNSSLTMTSADEVAQWPTLDISTTTAVDPNIFLTAASGDSRWRIHNDVSQTNRFTIGSYTAAGTLITTPFTITKGGYIGIGNGAPAIRTKKLSGTTAATEGGSVNVTHGLLYSKILSFTAVVDSGSAKVPAEFTVNGTYQFGIYATTTTFSIKNATGNSSSILSKPIDIFVTYEE